MSELQIQVYENQQLVYSVKCAGLVELGRQAEGEQGPYMLHQEGNRCRVVIASLNEQPVSRRLLMAEALEAGKVRISNLSRVALKFSDGSPLEAGASRVMALPASLTVGNRKVGIQAGDTTPALQLEEDQATPLDTLVEAPAPPGSVPPSGRPKLPAAPSDFQNDTMIRWLQAAMDVLQSAAGSSEFFDKAAGALVDQVGLDSGKVLLYKNGKWHPQAHKLAAYNRQGDERKASRHLLDRILEEKRTFWQSPAGSGVLGSLVGVRSVVAAPILDKSGAVLGALYGDRGAESPRAGLTPLTKLDGLLVQLLAGAVAAGLARIEQEQAELLRQKKFLQYERELQIGRDIQISFLPEALPQPAGWEIVAHFQPAREVAGDFYDSFPLSANHVALVIADVCDKGVGAALFMALFRSLIRAFCVQSGLKAFMGVSEDFGKPADVALLPANQRRDALLGDLITLLAVEHTNKYVTSNHASACMFVTLFLGILDTASGELSYVNAGHDPPTILGQEGIKTRLEPTGPVVGLMPDASFDLCKIKLEPGDILLTHTDGVTDARDPAGKSFSEKRFLALLQDGAPSVAALVERLVTELRLHIGAADQFDDITLLAARRASG